MLLTLVRAQPKIRGIKRLRPGRDEFNVGPEGHMKWSDMVTDFKTIEK
jgi:hypothetical protein